MDMQQRISSSLWAVCGGMLVALPWLVPNHQVPWVAFHSDAVAGVAWGIIAAMVLFRSKPGLQLCSIAITALIVIVVLGIQYVVGIVPFSGSAFLSLLYVLGFFSIFCCAKIIEMASSQRLLDIVFLGIAIASFISVGLQLTQWLDVVPRGLTDIWVFDQSTYRPSGNLGQPNQLASLLVWGLISLLWAHHREVVRYAGLVLGMFWLGIGLALTESRSSLIAISLLGLLIIYFRKLWGWKRAIAYVLIGAGVLVICFSLVPKIADLLSIDHLSSMRSRTDGEVRLDAWKMFIDASLNAPLFGFGWNQVVPAQLDVVLQHPHVVGRTFSHTHNLFLDLVIWVGWPIGLLISFSLLLWLTKAFQSIENVAQLLMLFPVLTIGVHAMFELPLHYAYFLLPTGFFMGAASVCIVQKRNIVLLMSKASLALTSFCAAIMLLIVIVDYIRVEEEFLLLRFEGARIGNLSLGKQPDVVVLNQIVEIIRFARATATSNMGGHEIEAAKTITSQHASLSNLFKMAQIDALNHKPDTAVLWLRKACALLGSVGCNQAKQSWLAFGRDHQNISIPDWPSNVLGEKHSLP